MPEQTELFLQLIGDEEEEAVAPLLMQHLLNRGMEQIPEIIQTGGKKGQTLKAHIQNVVCFAFHLAQILESDDDELMHLVAAAFVHDLNKLPEYAGKSYDTIATAENVEKLLKKALAQSSDDFDLSTERIVSIIRGHSGYYHVDGDSLFASQHHDVSRAKLIGILQAADILDLSHHFHEKDQKEKALRKLNGLVKDFQYQYTWHYFADNRGIYTNLIQNSIVDLYVQQDAVPLMFYPQGVWYLIKKHSVVEITPEDVARNLEKQIASMSLKDPSKSLNYAKVGFKFTQNPFKLDLSADEIINLLAEVIVNRKDKVYHDKFAKLNTASGTKCFQAYRNWMNKSSKRAKDFEKAEKNYAKVLEKAQLKFEFNTQDEKIERLTAKQKNKIKASELKFLKLKNEVALERHFQSDPLWEKQPDELFSAETDVLRLGDLAGSFAMLLLNFLEFASEDAWNCAAETAGLPIADYPELQFFNAQSDRGFRIAALLHKSEIDFENVQKKYSDYLEQFIARSQSSHTGSVDCDILNYIKYNLKTEKKSLNVDAGLFKQYGQSDHKQCSHCGGGQGLELMKGDLPKGVKPQLFSNRLKGGGGDPKRNVCRVCRQSFTVERLVSETYNNHYYLHFFADGGEHSSHAEPAVFLEALKNGLTNLQKTDCRSFLMQPGAIIRTCLDNKSPRLYGSPKKQFGLIAPAFSKSISGQITLGLNPPSGKKSNAGTQFVFALFHLLIIAKRFNLRGIMSKSSIPPLKADEFDTIYIDHVPLAFIPLIPSNNMNPEAVIKLWRQFTALFGLRNTYEMIDEKEIVNICKILYDSSGLELFYYLNKAYSRSKRTRDLNVKPWRFAWPYIKLFIQEEKLMPIKRMAEIALKNHFKGTGWKENALAKPLDLAFSALSKHHEPETEEDLKMVIWHDTNRGLERLSASGSLGKDRYEAVKMFVDIFFEQLFKTRYRSDKNRMIKDQRRIRAAFLGYLNFLRTDKSENKGKES